MLAGTGGTENGETACLAFPVAGQQGADKNGSKTAGAEFKPQRGMQRGGFVEGSPFDGADWPTESTL